MAIKSKKSNIGKSSSKTMKPKRTQTLCISHQERELTKLMDEYILNATEEELVKLQKVDVNTQLDGNWFYDTYNYSNQIKKQRNITTKKILSK